MTSYTPAVKSICSSCMFYSYGLLVYMIHINKRYIACCKEAAIV